MPAVKTKRISTLIESQLPEFITTEYELFSKFVQKYYEAQEVQGGTLDIINNIQKYADIDYYEKNLLKQNDILAAAISPTDTDITLSDAQSFPTKNGYVRIGDEIIFYETRTDTVLQGCSRGVSGNTTLGDLYDSSNFVSTDAAAHAAGVRGVPLAQPRGVPQPRGRGVHRGRGQTHGGGDRGTRLRASANETRIGHGFHGLFARAFSRRSRPRGRVRADRRVRHRGPACARETFNDGPPCLVLANGEHKAGVLGRH